MDRAIAALLLPGDLDDRFIVRPTPEWFGAHHCVVRLMGDAKYTTLDVAK
jgi:hypothetical protein